MLTKHIMSSDNKLAERLKETVLSKNNATRVYRSLNNGAPLNISKQDKAKLGQRIVQEINNTYLIVDFTKLNSRNFDQIITGINKKVVNNMNKYINRGLGSLGPSRPEYDSRHDHERITEPNRQMPMRQRDDYMRGYEEEEDLYNNESSSDESMGEKVKRMEAERYSMMARHKKPPKDIDFSLDPKDKRKKKERDKRRAEHNFDKFQSSRGSKPMKRSGGLDDYYAPITDVDQMTGEDELDKIYDTRITGNYIKDQDPEYDAMLDPYENNINSYTIGVDPTEEDYDDETPLDVQLKMYEDERNGVANKKKPTRRRRSNKPEPEDQEEFQQPVTRNLPQHRRQMPPQYHQPPPPPSSSYYHQPSPPHMPHNGKQVRFQPPSPYQSQYMQQPYPQPLPQSNIQQMIDDAVHQCSAQYQAKIEKYQAELNNLRSKPSNESESTQVKLLNDELRKSNDTIIALKERIKSGNSSSMSSDDKLQVINEKKQEIYEQLKELKATISEASKATEEEKEVRASLEEKKKEIRSLIEKNLSAFNNCDKNEVVNTENCIRNAHIFTHEFKKPINTLLSLEINDYSFPNALHNITPYNNSLYILLDNNPSIMCDDNVTYSKTKNIHKITVVPGNYDAEHLTEVLNNVLKQMGLKMQLKQTNAYISFYSESQIFSLMTDFTHYPNNILSVLGFDHDDRCMNDKNFISSKSCDLRADRIISLYILNINRTKVFCKLNMTSRKVSSFCFQLNPPLQNVDKLDLEFRDSKNNPVFFAGKNVMLDFTIKSIEKEITEVESDAPNTISEADLYDQISSLMDS